MKTSRHEKLAKAVYICCDVLLIAAAMYISVLQRYGNTISEYILVQYLPVFILGGIITLFFLSYYKLHTTNREWTHFDEISRIIKALIFSFLPTAGAVFFLQTKIVSRAVFINSWLIMFILLSLWRIVKRIYIKRLIRKGFNNFNVLFIGAGRTSNVLINEIKQNPSLGFNIIGFLDDDMPQKTNFAGFPVLNTLGHFEKVLQQHFIDVVFLTIPHSRETIHHYMTITSKYGISLRVVPDYYDFLLGEVSIYRLGYIPTFEYHARSIHGADLVFKRIFDFITSSFLLLVFAPFFLIIGLVIKINSAGPVFYRSKRCGKKGRIFSFYKFRTMICDAEKQINDLASLNEKDGPVFKMKNDPRITKVGKFLRKYSIDELPQLWNVLKGDMSLVGPRPPIPEEVEKYDVWHMQRLSIRPGITCLWQIRGRSNLSFRRWMKLDMFYIENWSFWLDIKILFKTISVVLKGDGAY